MHVLLRLFCATVSAVIAMFFTNFFGKLLFQLSPYWNCYADYCYEQWLWYQDLVAILGFIVGAFWMAAWAYLEIRNLRRPGRPFPRLHTHLSYGPIATLALSIVLIPATHLFLIQYSRWQIVSYIHSDAPVTEEPSFKLHDHYRGWCGNGISANRYYLYGATPAAYIDDPDPAVRARALRASMDVYDWSNHPSDGPSVTVLRKARADRDPIVRAIADEYLPEFRLMRGLD